MQAILSAAFVVLFVASMASLGFKNEGVRGGGRVVLGFAVCVLGAYMWSEPGGHLIMPVVFACGVITAALGARKFARRHEQ